ncbi:hypothetical protein FGSG_05730 [Fusarium graminearum PH-1]|uniref:Uncharacterized protein n=1 Tax=Gibberella zeae (strain ATCC MYA-4620 / CBS 123657 / FGSC 9075 / NRRL 31084 / PH-1) TaxID=229533 RepID=I1RNY4_GIBZE|nr:hypothetical protein FGSG_05730 [Fusarium graminearum PH-1]ESU11735.1 hypothetical protein FGSG_05730 [Fusarium graminearum PH-1]EYB29578.1 hypothetical protein FG05_05730 [Fusarium graminearum]|eukprot:XP_011324311.1 hypothetical protein FGSG_05730 [Fusarium graminearum PH-1]
MILDPNIGAWQGTRVLPREAKQTCHDDMQSDTCEKPAMSTGRLALVVELLQPADHLCIIAKMPKRIKKLVVLRQALRILCGHCTHNSNSWMVIYKGWDGIWHAFTMALTRTIGSWRSDSHLGNSRILLMHDRVALVLRFANSISRTNFHLRDNYKN